MASPFYHQIPNNNADALLIEDESDNEWLRFDTQSPFSVRLGAAAIAKDITIGSNTAASSLVLYAGTGTSSFNCEGALNLTGKAASEWKVVGGALVIKTETSGQLTVASAAELILRATQIEMNATGSGGVTIDSADDKILIGSAANGFNIEIGTAGARTVFVGNGTSGTSLDLKVGATGTAAIASNQTDHSTTVGSTTGSSPLLLQAGTGALSLSGQGALNLTGRGNSAWQTQTSGNLTLKSAGLLNIDTTGQAITIGSDTVGQTIGIGTGAAGRDITVGNNTGGTSFKAKVGTGVIEIGVDATNHPTTIGTTTLASKLTLLAGTNGIVMTSFGPTSLSSVGISGWSVTGGELTFQTTAQPLTFKTVASGLLKVESSGALDIQANGAGGLTVDSSSGPITIGGDADAHSVSIGTATVAPAGRAITIGNDIGATSVTVKSGTGVLAISGKNSVSITAEAESTWKTTTGPLNISGFGGLNLQGNSITAIAIDGSGEMVTFPKLTSFTAAGTALTVGNNATISGTLTCSTVTSAASTALALTGLANSTWQVNGGTLTIQTTGAELKVQALSSGALTLTGGGTSSWSTASGALNISGAGGLNLQGNATTGITVNSGGTVTIPTQATFTAAGTALIVNNSATISNTLTCPNVTSGSGGLTLTGNATSGPDVIVAMADPRTSGSILECRRANSPRFRVEWHGGLNVLQYDATAGGVFPMLSLNGGVHTNLTAGAELNSVYINPANPKWSDSASVATQRFTLFASPTIRFSGAQTCTTAATVAIAGAVAAGVVGPTTGGDTTITNNSALSVGGSIFGGPTSAGMTYAAIKIPAHTVTVSGSTGVTASPSFTGVSIEKLTISNPSSVTLDATASLYIADAPANAPSGSSVTITKAYSLWIAAGLPRIDSGVDPGIIETFLGPVGPSGAHTDVQTWLQIDVGGTTRYIPCW